MKEFDSRITRKGQVTIPVEVRRALGLRPRDRVLFELEGEVARISRASSKLLAGYGAVTPKERPEDLRKVREEFEKGVAEEVISETE